MDAQVNALDLACRKGEEDFRLLAEGRTTELTELQDNYSNEQIIFVEEIAKIKVSHWHMYSDQSIGPGTAILVAVGGNGTFPEAVHSGRSDGNL